MFIPDDANSRMLEDIENMQMPRIGGLTVVNTDRFASTRESFALLEKRAYLRAIHPFQEMNPLSNGQTPLPVSKEDMLRLVRWMKDEEYGERAMSVFSFWWMQVRDTMRTPILTGHLQSKQYFPHDC